MIESEWDNGNEEWFLKCGECGKKLIESTEPTELKEPVGITKFDIEYRYKRKAVYICCGKVRMVNPNSGKLSSYPIP